MRLSIGGDWPNPTQVTPMWNRPVAVAIALFVALTGCFDAQPAGNSGERDQNRDDSEQCVQLTPLWSSTAEPAAVSLHFQARHCDDGTPFDALSLDHFEIAENGQTVDAVGQLRELPQSTVRPYVTLLIDGSDTGLDDLDDVQDSARAFVDRLLVDDPIADIHIGIDVFDGSSTPITTWQLPVDDRALLHERIDALAQWAPADAGEPDIFGAYAASNQALRAHQFDVAGRNHGGTLPAGHTVMIAADESVDSDATDAFGEFADDIDADRSLRAGEGPAVQSWAVTADYNRAEQLEVALGSDHWVRSGDGNGLEAPLLEVADGIEADLEASYVVAFCSMLRSDGADIDVAAPGFDSNTIEFTVDAGDFDEGCNLDSLHADCADRECGGLLCGGCDDVAEVCDSPDSGQCVLYCIDQVICDDVDVVTDLGHDHNCYLAPDVMACDDQCVATDTDDDHCGDCGVQCSAPTSECVGGTCQCDDGTLDCDGECVDVASDDDHCGSCGNTCPDGIDCVDGQCPCDGDAIACDGECVDVLDSDDHCGSCSNECGDMQQCDGGVCACSDDLSLCDGTCVDIFSDGDHCGGCGNECAADQSCDNASCVCDTDGQANCGGACIDVTDDEDNCGGCDITCSDQQSCDDGNCICDDDELLNCDGSCTDTDTDDDHCGDCGEACGDGDFCDGGTCESLPILDDIAISAGIDHSCAIDTIGTALCWGRDDYDQSSALSVPLTAIGTGDRYNCAVDPDGDVLCWGRNISGESVPPANLTVDAVAAGWNHSCGVDTDGSLDCWGSDQHGKASPPSGDFVDVGWNHSCALGDDDTIDCWGDGSNDKTDPPSGDFVALSVGMNHACAIDTSGGIDCWGADGSGQSNAPSGNFDDIAAGGAHSCAIDTSGDVHCWGSDTNGQGASGVPSGSHESIDAGFQHTCAVDTADDITCWGDDDYGQSTFPGW